MPPPPPPKRRCSSRFGTAAEPGTRVSAVPAWQEATQRVSWNFVSPFLLAATQLMLAAHARNLDKDCVGISELGKVLANTDSCSSRDRATRTPRGAGIDFVVADMAHNTTIKSTKKNIVSQWLAISYSIL